MINKFKDFLKKFSRKRNENLSDQVDDSDGDQYIQDILDEDAEEAEAKSSWKDKFKVSLPSFRKKSSEEEAENDFSEDDKTGETPLPVMTDKVSWRNRLSDSVSQVKSRFGTVNFREWKMPEGFKSKGGESIFLLSPSLSKNVERFLSRESRDTIHQISLVVLICSFTYTVGKITALVLKGAPEVGSSRQYVVDIDLEKDFNAGSLNQVRSINIFRTNTGLGSRKRVADTKCDEAQQSSNLPIKLVNTVVLQDSVKSLASVQVRGDRDLQEVREGDQISNLAKIFKINRLGIVIKNLESGICESIESDKLRETRSAPYSVMSPTASREYKTNLKKMAGIENEGNKFKISKALLDEKMKDIAGILTQARAIKIQNPDGSISFKLTEMDPNGMFTYLGLQDQDIITSINGKPIYDMNEVMSLFARIKNLDKLQLGLKREGSESVLDYNIQK